MGLHLLQRSMLPTRAFKCIITLTGTLRVAEDYAGTMKQFVKVPLSDLILDEHDTNPSGADFILQMRLADAGTTFTLQDNFDNFDRQKFRIGGPAIQEVKARGFQIAEQDDSNPANQSASYEPIIAKCCYLRITIKDWHTINDPEVFSPEVVGMIGTVSNPNAFLKSNSQNQAGIKTTGPSEENTSTTPRQPITTKRPCSCWKRDESVGLDTTEGGNEASVVKHSDACDSDWAALFGGYVQENKLKAARVGSGGMMSSRWAAGA